MRWGAGNKYAGAFEMIANLGTMIYAAVGLIAFIDYLNYPTAYNALRAWKKNYMIYWVVVAVTVLSL